VSASRRTRICRRCREQFEPAATGRRRLYCSDSCRVAAWRKRRRRSVHFSSASAEWSTPQDLFDELDAELGPFDVDAAASAENAKCGRYFTAAEDGLAQTWRGRVWLNPPYGRQIALWVEKAWRSAQETAELVVCLVPARPDTRWWHDYCTCGEVRFLRGRLRFNGSASGAPFPSAVVVFRNADAANETRAQGEAAE